MADSNQEEFAVRIQSAVGGDRDALLQLLLDVQHDLGRFVAFKIGNARQSQFNEEDILQEVFVSAFRDVQNLRADNRKRFLAWLTTIATNQIIDATRRRKAKKREGDRIRVDCAENVFSDRAIELIAQLPEVDGGTPSQFAARHEAVHAMNIAVANLPKDQREAVLLHFFEKLSLQETADRMDRTWDSVRGLLQRAKRSLRDSMQKSSLWLSRKG